MSNLKRNRRYCYPCTCIRQPSSKAPAPIYGGIYSLDEFETTLVSAPATVIPTNYVTPPLSGTNFNGSSLIVEKGVYIIHISAHVITQNDAAVNLAITNNGTPLTDDPVVETKTAVAGIDTVINSTFYANLTKGALNIIMWAKNPVDIKVLKCSLIACKIDES